MSDSDLDKRPFSTLLDGLFTAAQPPVAELYRLSDMDDAESAAFWSRWDGAESARRLLLLRHLTDLSEENFVVDFTPIFIRCLEDADGAVRVAALEGMWDSGDLSLLPRIRGLMERDGETAVRAAAARALSHFVLMAEWGQLPKRILPPLVDALIAVYEQPEVEFEVKRAVLETLGSANHPKISGFIREGYEDELLPMQMSAVFAMGRSADRQWVPLLLGEMESSFPEMRAEAARAIGDIGSSDAFPILSELIYDEDRDVQLAAISALGQIGGETAEEILRDFTRKKSSTNSCWKRSKTRWKRW
jgi:HEAT repeat protein